MSAKFFQCSGASKVSPSLCRPCCPRRKALNSLPAAGRLRAELAAQPCPLRHEHGTGEHGTGEHGTGEHGTVQMPPARLGVPAGVACAWAVRAALGM